MVKSIITIICIICIFSCASNQKLDNGTKIPTKKFKNIGKFNPKILNVIDPNYFYKKIDFYMADKNFKKVRDIGQDVERKIQLYDNGRIRFFSLGIEDPNPQNAGRRGIIYLKNNSLKIDAQSADQDGSIFISTYSVKIEGDKIFLLEDNFLFSRSEYICFVYQKSEKVPEEWKKYKVDW